jgi:hypothetical protein
VRELLQARVCEGPLGVILEVYSDSVKVKIQAPGTGSRNQEPWNQPPGTGFQVPGTRYQNPGHRAQLPGTGDGVNSCQHQTSNTDKIVNAPTALLNLR